MRILFVYPRFPDTFWSFRYALKLISKKALYPPLSLLTVAAMIPSDWEKKLIDMNVTDLNDADIMWADYVFLSAMDVQSDSVEEVISRCNQIGVKIVAGGSLFTTRYDEFSGVTHLVLGEAEANLDSFLCDLSKDSAKKIYTSGEPPSIRKTPPPLWSLIDMNEYASMNIQYSRGCPYDCEFCDIVSLYGHVPRTKTHEQIINELETIYDHGWRGQILFVDDNFIGNKKKLKEDLLPAVIEWSVSKNYPFTFVTQTSINLADDEELMDLMTNAGFNKVFVGIESPNEESLVECNKSINTNLDLVESVRKIHNHGLEVQGGFIIGFDNDPSSIFDNQINFIQTSGIVTAMVGLLQAPRSTKLYERLMKENRLVSETTGDNVNCSINFVPKMEYQLLIDGYKRVLNTIYSPKSYNERIYTFYTQFKPQKKQTTKIQFLQLVWLVKSLWFMGVVERGQIYFWKLLFTTLYKYPNFFFLSIRFAIYRLHFSKLIRRLYSEQSNMK